MTAADARPYFLALEKKLAAAIDDGEKALLLNRELEAWEGRLRRLELWAATADHGEPNPFHPPLDAWTCSRIILALAGLLAAVRDKIKARIAAAEAAINYRPHHSDQRDSA
jgi:hypothetical protein